MKRISLITSILIGLFAIGVGCFYYLVWNKPHPTYENLKPDFSMEAAELYNEFSSDPESAQLKYNGKMLEISGMPTMIEKVDSMTILVFVYNEGMFGSEGIRCTLLPGLDEELEQLKNKDNAKIKCFCSGYNDVDVILEKCSINQ